MQTVQKPKGFSLERLLNDPMAMFGAMGVLGALVVTVWVTAGSSSTKSEDPSGTFQPAASVAAPSRPASSVGSNISVAKLKGRSARGSDGAESLKDAGGSASASADGALTGTLSEIEAAQKLDTKAAPAQPEGNRSEIPVESRGHVPGMDSTKLADAAKGTMDFGATSGAGSSSNAGFAATGGLGPDAGAAQGAEQSLGAPPELGEGGPLLAAAPARAGAAAGGTRQFLRGQAAGGTGPAAASVQRRAGSAPGAGSTGGSALPGTATPGFDGGGAAASGGGSSAASASSESGERMAFAGGGAPKAAGLGGMGGGRGAQFAESGGGASSQKSVSAASKKELNDQAAKHLDEAQSYRGAVVLPLAQRQSKHAAELGTKLGQAGSVLKSLDSHLAAEQKAFKGAPSALSALTASRALISGGGESLRGRVDSAKEDAAAGVARVLQLPNKCDFRPVVKEKVFHEWEGEGWHPRYYKGQRLEMGPGGKWGYYTEEDRQLDLHGVATRGQDLLEGAARRASNVRREALAGVTMVDPEFGPAVDALNESDPKAAARLAADAERIKADLRRVAQLLPEQVTETAQAASSAQGGLQRATSDGFKRIDALAEKVAERRLGYPDGPARDALDRNMADARHNSREALAAVNSLTGTSSDTLFVLTSASRSATYAMVDLCYSRDRLKDLAGKAKN